MKQSDKLRVQFEQEENDLKAMGIGVKLIREERFEKFEERWLPVLQKIVDVAYNEKTGAYVIQHPTYGSMDFYPKANKLLIRKFNRWIKPGLRYLVQEFDLSNQA